jgi:archaellum component FlaC
MQGMERLIAERDEANKGQAKLIEERWAAMQGMEGAIAERDEAIAGQAKLLEERWSAMRGMEGAIAERDEVIGGQAKLLEERAFAIQKLEQTIKSLVDENKKMIDKMNTFMGIISVVEMFVLSKFSNCTQGAQEK